MQVVILAAGKGSRMKPITDNIPKPLIKICGKNFIERNIELLPKKKITEVIIVVNYLKEQIINNFGDYYNGIKIRYVFQEKPLGTAHALFSCKKYLKKDFLVMMSDDFYSKKDITKIINSKFNIIMIKKSDRKFNGGVILKDENNNLIGIVEGNHKKGDYINTALYKLDKNIFKFKLEKIGGGEYGLPQTIMTMSKKYPVKIIESKDWQQISDFKDLKNAEKFIKKQSNKKCPKNLLF